MLTHVNQVFVATKFVAAPTTIDALSIGDVFLADGDYKIGTAGPKLLIGLVTAKENVTMPNGTVASKSVVRWSNPINKAKISNVKANEFVAATEDSISIAFAGTTIEVGHRYVLRLVSNDIYEHPGKFSQVYEVIATTTTVKDLVDAFVAKINRHKGARVVASNTVDTTLVLTAKVKDNQGLEAIDYYSQVSIDAFVYKTIPTGILSNVSYPVAGLTITKTQGTPGKGNPKIIRDRELKALGYRGITHRANGVWPYVAPATTVNLAGQYGEFTIEWDTDYLSPDNAYVKSTPLALEVYFSTADEATELAAAINALTVEGRLTELEEATEE